MDLRPEEHVVYQLANAPVRSYPFPHLYIDGIFPADYYAELKRKWPSSRFVSLESTGRVTKGTYAERFIMPLTQDEIAHLQPTEREFWSDVLEWLLGTPRILYAIMDKFEPHLRQRFGAALETIDFTHEALIVRDQTKYSLGPHTDSTRKVVSVLFYCPDDDSLRHLGTSLYRPIDADFRCPGGPHHAFEAFRRIATMEYRPNALFAFVKTDQSFHGVDPVEDAGALRKLILYDIQVQNASAAA